MTLLLDIAALLALTATLTAAPLHGAVHDARIDRQIRHAQRGAPRN